MTLPEITGPVAALLAGLITSLHCVGMCGPLACAVCPKGATARGSVPALSVYHGMRLFSYSAAGVAAGFLGQLLAPAWNSGAVRWIPWIFVAFFVAMALGLDSRIPIPRFASQGVAKFMRPLGTAGTLTRAGALGAITPLIPCGPLYLVLGIAVAGGSALGGGLIMLAFAAGTVPLALLAQTQLVRLRGIWSPRTMGWIQKGLALVAAGLIVFRMLTAGEFTPGDAFCPLCH